MSVHITNKVIRKKKKKWHHIFERLYLLCEIFLLYLLCTLLCSFCWLFDGVYRTFNNISVISWRSVLLVEENGRLWEDHRSVPSHFFLPLWCFAIFVVDVLLFIFRAQDFLGQRSNAPRTECHWSLFRK